MEYTFRQLTAAEAKEAYGLILERIAWMNERGIRHWNIWDYEKAYPLAYYEARAGEGVLYGLVDPAGKLLSFAVILEKDVNWTDGEPALYVHTLVSSVSAKGAGRAMLEEAEALARRMGKTWLRLDSARENEPLTAFYRDFGFQDAGTCSEGPYRGILRQKRLETGNETADAPAPEDALWLTLVNSAHPVPADWLDHVELVTVRNPLGSEFQVERTTLEHFQALRERVSAEGVGVELLNSYRTIRMQEETWAINEKKNGLDYCRRYVAIPGCSEHHTGLAIDVYLIVDGTVIRGVPEMIAAVEPFAKVHAHLAECGFILRYPQGAEDITGIAYEPWHLRYVGVRGAAEIAERGITLEEYALDSSQK